MMILWMTEMSSYSLGGYKIAALARSRKTLMVEGNTDSLVMKRIFLQVSMVEEKFNVPLIDTPIIVKDASLSGMGNKARVSHIVKSLGSRDKVVGLVDREWEGFCLQSLAANDDIDADSPYFVTKGHSIENYFFDRQVCAAFLARRYADIVGAEVFSLVEERFDAIVRFAFAYSVAMGRRHFVSRAESLLEPADIHFAELGFSLLSSLENKLSQRGVAHSDISGLRDEVAEISEKLQEHSLHDQIARWRSHGHLGDEAIWACIGRLAMTCGVALDDAQSIAYGFREDRLRSAADAIAAHELSHLSPVDLIVDWAK